MFGVLLSVFTADVIASLPAEHDDRARRISALARFDAADLPTVAAEEWRYSRVGELSLQQFPPAPRPAEAAALAPSVVGLLAESGAVPIVTVDGWLLEAVPALPGLEVFTATGDEIGALSGEPDAFVTLNAAMAPSPLVLRVAPGSVLAEPIVIVHISAAGGVSSFTRTIVELGRGAEATVVEINAALDDADIDSLCVPVTELAVGEAANLRYVAVQLLGARAWQIGLQASTVGRDATLTASAVALGGHYARLRTDSALVGRGGTTRLRVAYFGAGEQMHDFRTVQGHRAPKASSDLVYKGVVANRSRSVYTGLIRVEKGAVGTNALQTNRNLVLHQGAHAESVPNLEIEDNDVRCSHASAVGPVSADERFYLESRGVPSEVAERLIAVGFLDEILAALPVAGFGKWLRSAVAAKLDDADVLEAGLVGAGK